MTKATILLLCLASPIHAIVFRPPAIPLITTDPFTQVWMRGDTSTSAGVTHWDGASKSTTGLIRVDGQTYTFLGGPSINPLPSKPGPTTKMDGHDAAAGKCGIAHYSCGEDECNERCYADPTCQAYVMTVPAKTCYLKVGFVALWYFM
jgi:hypothetical protein